MEYKSNDDEYITLSELLKHFDLDLNLSSNLLSEEFGIIFKSASLKIQNGIYNFKIDNHLLKINPSNKEETLCYVEYPNPSKGIDFSFFACFNWDGEITSIT